MSNNIDRWPLSKVLAFIDKGGLEKWEDLEVETLLLELGVEPSDISVDKLGLAKAVRARPELFYEDVLFFLHATDVMNNLVADFSGVPFPSSLELAFSIFDMAKCVPGREFSSGVKKVIQHLLTEEGYHHTIAPFPEVDLVGGTEEGDMKDKETAIKMYVLSMYQEKA